MNEPKDEIINLYAEADEDKEYSSHSSAPSIPNEEKEPGEEPPNRLKLALERMIEETFEFAVERLQSAKLPETKQALWEGLLSMADTQRRFYAEKEEYTSVFLHQLEQKMETLIEASVRSVQKAETAESKKTQWNLLLKNAQTKRDFHDDPYPFLRHPKPAEEISEMNLMEVFLEAEVEEAERKYNAKPKLRNLKRMSRRDAELLSFRINPYQYMREQKEKEAKKAAEKKARHEYTLADVLKNPGKSAWKEIFEDVVYSEKFSGSRLKKGLKSDACLLASFGALSVPHELIHAATNTLTGGANERIVINSIYGGGLWEKIIPGVESELLFPLLGGYVSPEHYGSAGAEFLVCVAPYIMTPIGLYCVMKGKQKKSLPLWMVGVGAVGAHAGGIIGDWWHAGRVVVNEIVEFTYNALNFGSTDDSWLVNGLVAVGGFYLGAKMLSFTYRSMKGSLNSLGYGNIPKDVLEHVKLDD